MVIGLREDQIAAYRQLHDGAGVRDLLSAANIHNFSIFLTRMDDGNFYEFASYDYIGDDYDADMASLAADPRNQAWLALCDPMQRPLHGESGWRQMELIFFNE